VRAIRPRRSHPRAFRARWPKTHEAPPIRLSRGHVTTAPYKDNGEGLRPSIARSYARACTHTRVRAGEHRIFPIGCHARPDNRFATDYTRLFL
jgi:hypothetical protein